LQQSIVGTHALLERLALIVTQSDLLVVIRSGLVRLLYVALMLVIMYMLHKRPQMLPTYDLTKPDTIAIPLTSSPRILSTRKCPCLYSRTSTPPVS
jgi:hypothetical protein